MWTKTNYLELIHQKIHTPNKNIGRTILSVPVQLFQHLFPNSYPKFYASTCVYYYYNTVSLTKVKQKKDRNNLLSNLVLQTIV